MLAAAYKVEQREHVFIGKKQATEQLPAESKLGNEELSVKDSSLHAMPAMDRLHGGDWQGWALSPRDLLA